MIKSDKENKKEFCNADNENSDEDVYTDEDEEDIKQRLKSLGYL